MRLSRKSILSSLFWSSAGFITGLVRTILLVPVFLANWDEHLYGFWLLVANFYAISVYVIEGFSRYTINEYSKLFFQDKIKAYKYFGSSFRLIVLLTGGFCIVFFVLLHFTTPIEKIFHVNGGDVKYHYLQYCLLVMFMLACIHSVAKYLVYAVIPHGRIQVPERFIAVYILIEAIIWLIAAAGRLSLINLFLIYSLSLSLVSLLFVWVMVKNNRFYKIILFRDKTVLQLNAAKGSLSLIVSNFCEKFTVEGLNFIVAGFFSALMVPVYTTMRTMANFIVTFTNMVVATFTIEYQKHYVAKDGKSLLNLFNGTWLLIGFIINYGIIIFYPSFPYLFSFWTSGKLIFDEAFFTCILATSICIAYGSNIIIYLKAVNRVREVIVVSVARATILLSLIVIFPKQLIFIGYSLLITEVLINVVLLSGILYYELGRFQYGAVAKKILWNILPFAFTAVYVLLNGLIDIEPYLKMTMALILITVAYFIQIMKMDNEALMVRLQILKYRLLGKK